MTKQDKDEAKRILALLVDAAEHDQTPEEAEQELVADGVNVTEFLARVHQAVQEKQKEERLAWRNDARRNADAFAQTQDVSDQFASMTRAELVAEAQRYPDRLHFKNFEEATEDDLRSQLADRARLEQLAKKK
jgi:hypothetical protein